MAVVGVEGEVSFELVDVHLVILKVLVDCGKGVYGMEVVWVNIQTPLVHLTRLFFLVQLPLNLSQPEKGLKRIRTDRKSTIDGLPRLRLILLQGIKIRQPSHHESFNTHRVSFQNFIVARQLILYFFSFLAKRYVDTVVGWMLDQ